ncbi:MAG TPA: hypothetical protein VNK46_00985 [Nitrospiraceae bacterium]|jgi:hypothetical protein|nr:hypothetical protein [Nitrospiraceae bacterium]
MDFLSTLDKAMSIFNTNWMEGLMWLLLIMAFGAFVRSTWERFFGKAGEAEAGGHVKKAA